jgi:hypothetical protein
VVESFRHHGYRSRHPRARARGRCFFGAWGTIVFGYTFLGFNPSLSLPARVVMSLVLWACLAGTSIVLGVPGTLKAMVFLSLVLAFINKRSFKHNPRPTNPPAV